MRTPTTVDRILEEAEAQLLEVVREAATNADYAAIDRARRVAEQIRRMRTADAAALRNGAGKETAGENGRAARSKRGASRRRQADGANGYPRFHVSNGTLCKVGWSKRRKTEYLHRVPLTNVKRILAAIDNLPQAREVPLRPDGLLKVSTLTGDNEVPVYQVYVTLAFLKNAGLATGVGRDGMLFDADLGERGHAALESLPRG